MEGKLRKRERGEQKGLTGEKIRSCGLALALLIILHATGRGGSRGWGRKSAAVSPVSFRGEKNTGGNLEERMET